MRNAYLRLEDDPATGRRHPILDGPGRRAADHPRDLPAGRRAPPRVSRPAADADPELSRPADGNGLPPRSEDRHRRARICARSGPAGSSISPGTSTASSGRSWPSTTESCSGTPCAGRRTRSRPCEVTGPGVLDVTAWRQAGSMTVHLVNLTNPMMMKGPFRELIPVGEQQVVVQLPAGADVQEGPPTRGGTRHPRRAGRHAAHRHGAVHPRSRGRCRSTSENRPPTVAPPCRPSTTSHPMTIVV